MRPSRPDRRFDDAREAAGNGLLDRRAFLTGSAGALAAGAFMAFAPSEARAAGPPETPNEMKVSGAPLSAYGSPATYEREVTRTLIRSQPGTTGAGSSRTPLEALEGIITPSGLHFERHHNGVPAIDPAQHQLLIHGLVAAAAGLHGGVAAALPDGVPDPLPGVLGQQRRDVRRDAAALTCGQTHGLVSCSEWTGVPLRLLLAEAGVDRVRTGFSRKARTRRR